MARSPCPGEGGPGATPHQVLPASCLPGTMGEAGKSLLLWALLLWHPVTLDKSQARPQDFQLRGFSGRP